MAYEDGKDRQNPEDPDSQELSILALNEVVGGSLPDVTITPSAPAPIPVPYPNVATKTEKAI